MASTLLQTTICEDTACESGCVQFITPIDDCFNGWDLFPDATESWGPYDIVDTIWNDETIERTIFRSMNSTCSSSDDDDDNDVLMLPLNECVGPFGKPRPWGEFKIVQQRPTNGEENDEGDKMM